MRRLLAATSAAAALTLSMTATTTPAGAEEGSGVSIGRVGIAASSGGYPSVSYGFYGLLVTFTDTTPDSTHQYLATATQVIAEGEEPGVVKEGEAYVWDGWDGGTPMQVYIPNDDDMEIGDTFDVVLSEYDGDVLVEQSAAVAHTVQVISHPSNLRMKRSSKKAVRVGEVVKMRWTGDFGEDVASVTQVIAARKGRTFGESRRDFLVCKNSYCPTKKGITYVSTRSKDLTTRFRVPKHFRGKTLVISIYGQAAVEDTVSLAAPWGWYYELKVRR